MFSSQLTVSRELTVLVLLGGGSGGLSGVVRGGRCRHVRFASGSRVLGSGGAMFTGGGLEFRRIAFVIDLLRHWIARVQIGAGVDRFGGEEQPRRDDADDGGKPPALLVRIVGAHKNEVGKGRKVTGWKLSGYTDGW